MTKERKLRLIGVAMCVPAVVMAGYLIAHPGVLLVAGLTAVATALCVYGIKLAKGDTIDEVRKDFMDDYNDFRDRD